MSRRPKYRPLSPLERSICERVRQVRRVYLATQARFAREIDLSRDQLASIEVGRVALRFEPGWRICEAMHINPLWLAFGEPDWQTEFAPFEFGPISANALFSDVMSTYREQYRSAVEGQLRQRLDPEKAARKKELWDQLLSLWDIRLSDVDSARLGHHVNWLAVMYPIVKHSLTFPTDVFDSLFSMKAAPNVSRWQRMQRRVQAATARRGGRAALARHLGVDRQIVTEWLKHSTRGPSAETTLRLLEWVQQAEAQQKQSAGVSEAPAKKRSKARRKIKT